MSAPRFISIVFKRVEHNLASGPHPEYDDNSHALLGKRQTLLVSAAVGPELDKVEEKGVLRLLSIMPATPEYVSARRLLNDILERPKARVSSAGSPALVGTWGDPAFQSDVVCDRDSCLVGRRTFKAVGHKLLDRGGSTAGTLSGNGLYLEEARLKGQPVRTLSTIASLHGEFRKGATKYQFDGKGQMSVSGKTGVQTYAYRIADSRTVELLRVEDARKNCVEATLHLFDNSLFSARLSRTGDVSLFDAD